MDNLEKLKSKVSRMEAVLQSLQEDLDEVYDRIRELEIEMYEESSEDEYIDYEDY